MGSYSQGWLPYGTNDASVVFRHPLTRQITTADLAAIWGGFTLRGSGLYPAHDSSRGMRGKDINGADAAYRFDSTTALGKQLSYSCQLSLEVETAWAAKTNAPAIENGAISLLSVVTSSDRVAVKGTTGIFATGNTRFYENLSDGGTGATVEMRSHGKGEYTTLNLGWWGNPGPAGTVGNCIVALDGLVLAKQMLVGANTAVTDLFNLFYLGNKRDTAGSYMSHYMRNLQICSVPPVFVRPSILTSVVLLGDSTMDATAVSGAQADCYAHIQFRRRFHQLGLTPYVTVSENSGYRVSLGTQLETVVPTVLAQQPSIVCIGAGTNDVGDPSYVSATFLAEYKDLIEQLMFGVAKTYRTPVRKIVVCTPFPRSDATPGSLIESRHADARAHIASLPAWWNTTYGAQHGNDRVVFADLFGKIALGHSWTNDASMCIDGVHPEYAANYIYGNVMADAVLTAMSG